MQRYDFGEYSLDLERGALFCRDDEVELRRQSYDVLCVLVRNAGKLVSKEQLFDEVWGNVAVTDDSITQCIADIRRALGDNDRTVVRTVPRRGFTFTADTTYVDEAATKRPRYAMLAIAGFAILALAVLLWPDESPPPASLAVMPFVDTGSYADNVSIGVAFSDELRDQLALVADLKIAPRSSSMFAVAQEADAATISEQLGVAHIIEGTFKLDDDGVRIGVQLVDSATGLVEWSQVFERQPAGIAEIQQAIAEHIVEELLPTDDARTVLASASLSAADIRYLARGYYEQVRDREAVDRRLLHKAISLYRELTELDPESAIAHARYADALLYSGDVDGAQAALDRALMLDPQNSMIQDTLGKLYFAVDSMDAGAAWQRAIELDPDNADAHASFAYWSWLGREADDAERHYRLALEADPHSLRRHGDLGNFLGTQGRITELTELIARVEERLETTFANDVDALRLVARLYELKGENDVAIAWAIRARDASPEDPESRWQLAELYASIGDDATALTLDPEPGPGLLFHQRRYDDLVDVTEELIFDDPADFMVRYLLAFAYNATGNYEGTLNVLRNAHPLAGTTYVVTTAEIEATIMLADALNELGRYDEARAIIEPNLAIRHIEQDDWWIHAYRACMNAIVGNDDEVRTDLAVIYDSARLPWYPMLSDSPCFRRFGNDPVYAGLIARLDERRAGFRAALPDTLARFDVSLQSPPAEK